MRYFILLAALILTSAAYAAAPVCNAGAEGTLVYNKDHKIVQFCNGTQWIGMVARIGDNGDTLADLTCEAGEIPKWSGSAWACAADETGGSQMPDTTPDPFTFTDQTGVATSTVVISNSITIGGIDAAASVSVTGGDVRINGGSWGTGGTIANGQILEVRMTSSASFGTAVTAGVTVGGVSDTWSVTTAGADTTPGAFDFTPDVTNAAPGTLITAANTVTISGINTSAPVSVTGAGAEVSINGGAWTTSGTIQNGQTLQLRLTSSASYSTPITATVDVGGVTDTWSVTTRAPNTCAAQSKTWLTNCTATVTAANHGSNGTGTIANPGGCGTAWYGSATFACADGALTYSSGTCTQQTACDTTPDAFSFTDVTGAALSTVTTSNSLTIAGINAAASVSVTGGEVRINGGPWVTGGTITNGQTLEVRVISSASNSTAVTATVTVGGVSDTWSVTTTSGAPVRVFLTAVGAGTWTVPANWNSANNTIEVIGGGGGYNAYGGDTWFNGASYAASSVAAKGGTTGYNGTGAGGQASDGIGTTKYSGGNGATAGTKRGGGGGGAGGPHGNGGAGASCGSDYGSGGGGASGGSSGGSSGSCNVGGNNWAGSGGGAPQIPGANGGGGGGGANGGSGTEWDATHGSGGGGGGGGDPDDDLDIVGPGGLYGGGAGGQPVTTASRRLGGGGGGYSATSNLSLTPGGSVSYSVGTGNYDGAQGIIVITYTP
jgi:ribosomal 50S subunit-recycling heat shock protein